MIPTSLSLLDRLKVAGAGSPDWARLQEIYGPLIRAWLEKVPGLGDESTDLAQEVLIVLIKEIPRFDRRREGSFRAWLRQVVVNRVRNHRRARRRRPSPLPDATDGFLDRLADPKGELASEWDLDHDRHVFQKLLAVVQPDFSPSTWLAFQRFAVDGLSAAEVADERGISVNAVIQAKARILRRLREEAGELLA